MFYLTIVVTLMFNCLLIPETIFTHHKVTNLAAVTQDFAMYTVTNCKNIRQLSALRFLVMVCFPIKVTRHPALDMG